MGINTKKGDGCIRLGLSPGASMSLEEDTSTPGPPRDAGSFLHSRSRRTLAHVGRHPSVQSAPAAFPVTSNSAQSHMHAPRRPILLGSEELLLLSWALIHGSGESKRRVCSMRLFLRDGASGFAIHVATRNRGNLAYPTRQITRHIPLVVRASGAQGREP